MKKSTRSRITVGLNLVAVVVAVAVLAVGFSLLVIELRSAPVAAAFTRVGGATSVETALEASRFWLTPPQLVVETTSDASQQIMLGAAQCAVAHDAPLVFTSPDPQRQREVDAAVNDWRQIETPEDLANPELMTIHRQRNILQTITLPEVMTIQNQPQVSGCLPKRHPADIARLSTLEVPNPLIRLPQVPARATLASVVVFAAAIEPGNPSDVAVGLALAAHMARANREKVSLVVVPHYLESDLALENRLQSQHELVTGGVVLGETPTVPEDTRVLLRQLLTSTDRQGFLGQLQASLGAVGPLVAALLALVGLGAAALAAPAIIAFGTSGIRELLAQQSPVGLKSDEPSLIQQLIRELRLRPRRYLVKLSRTTRWTPKGAEWLNAAAPAKSDLEQEVTISLRSGWTVIGKIRDPDGYKGSNVAVWRINEARLSQNGSPLEQARYVLVPVVDIELIRVNNPAGALGARQ